MSSPPFWPALGLGTVAILLFSWFFSIRAKRYHGIARFFVFEGILILVLLNFPVWFRDPFSPLQILSWLFLFISLILAADSIRLYLKLSKPVGQFENSTRLVVTGVYRFIRHPMYGSLGWFGLGAFLKRVTPLTSALAAVVLIGVTLTARIEEGEMRARFGDEYRAYLRRTKMFIPFLFLILAAIAPAPSATPEPLIRYEVSPDPTGARVTVEASFRLPSPPVYLKDFGQLETIRWFVDGRDVQVLSERAGDLTIFKDLPSSGAARAVYTLACVTDPQPGYRKRLMGSPSFLTVREGLLLGMNGKEGSDVDVEWRLPPGWTLALGRPGVQTFSETQKAIWAAGKTGNVKVQKFGGKDFRIAVFEGVPADRAASAVEALEKVFSYAWEKFGDLDGAQFGVGIFPHGAIGGGTALGPSLIGEDNLPVLVHEMLHWWTNFLSPAWFREGVHDYIGLRIMIDIGVLPPEASRRIFDEYRQERLRVVKREGKILSLAEASEAYDARKPAGDIYAFAPLFAAGLDREIQTSNPDASLEQVFAAVCRMRLRENSVRRAEPRPDVPAMIKAMTGYDPDGYFKRYFFVPVEDAGIVLK